MKQEPDTPCLSCNRLRGYIYTGPVHTEKPYRLEYRLCPWCIAEGAAAKRFGAIFNDAGTMDAVPAEIMAEIEERTPGFRAWQQETWLACCGDGAAFLGAAGAKELKQHFPDAIQAVRKHLKQDYDLSGADLEESFNGLKKDSEPTAYIFRCSHCESYLAYVDQS